MPVPTFLSSTLLTMAQIISDVLIKVYTKDLGALDIIAASTAYEYAWAEKVFVPELAVKVHNALQIITNTNIKLLHREPKKVCDELEVLIRGVLE
jgi:hypothetical protein